MSWLFGGANKDPQSFQDLASKLPPSVTGGDAAQGLLETFGFALVCPSVSPLVNNFPED